MHVEPVDPRDTKWELHAPAYRVYFWDGVAHEFEVTGADAPEVLAWADAQARRAGRTYVVLARVAGADGAAGLIRLAGWEQPSEVEPGTGGRPAYAVERPDGE